MEPVSNKLRLLVFLSVMITLLAVALAACSPPLPPAVNPDCPAGRTIQDGAFRGFCDRRPG